MADTQGDVVKASTVCGMFDLVPVACSSPRPDAERLPHPDVELSAGPAHVLPAVRHGGELCRAVSLPHPHQDSG